VQRTRQMNGIIVGIVLFALLTAIVAAVFRMKFGS
jgi:tetrahydromethanopterin S-methyltransferase subunit B